MKKIARVILSVSFLLGATLFSVASVELGPDDTSGGSNDANNNGAVTVTIDSASGGCFFFADRQSTCPTESDPDLRVEPWCTQNPGLCGNWVQTAFTNLDDATEIPSSGYISDEAGFVDCQEVVLNQVLFFKLSDGSFAKGIITNDVYTENSSECQHRITLQYIYPL